MDTEVTETPQPAKPDRTLLAILIAVGLLVVIALVVVLVRSSVRETFDPSTPEGVVQRYAQAVIDRDDAAASEYLTGRSEDCDYYDPGTANLRLTFESSKITGTEAVVYVSISSSYGGDPFSNYEYSYEDEFRLVKAGDSWLIDTAPYEFLSCGGN